MSKKSIHHFTIFLVLVLFLGLQQQACAKTTTATTLEEFVADFLKASELRGGSRGASVKDAQNQCSSQTDALIVRLPEIAKVMQQEMSKDRMMRHDFVITTEQGEQKTVHLSESCAECFSNGVSCGISNCWSHCLFSRCSDSCRHCFLDYCMPKLLSCVDASELASPC